MAYDDSAANRIHSAVTRRGSRVLDWKDATLVDMIVASVEYKATEDDRADVYIFFDDRLDTVPELREAREASTEV